MVEFHAMAQPTKKHWFPKEDRDAHWYEVFQDGTVQLREGAGLADARADQELGGPGFFPSPTTIIGAILAKPQLEAYKVKSALMGGLAVLHSKVPAFELARMPEENDQAFLQRGLATFLPDIADEEYRSAANKEGRKGVERAAAFGVDVHGVLDRFLKTGRLPDEGDPVREYLVHLRDWIEKNARRVVFSEKRMASRTGVAGTSDLGLELNDGRLVIADTKTGNWKAPRKDAELAPYFKLAHPLQISKYRQMTAENLGQEWGSAGGVILHLCSNKPLPVVPQWFSSQELDAYYRGFTGLHETWCLNHDYRPLVDRMRPAPAAPVPDVIPHENSAKRNAAALIEATRVRPPSAPLPADEF